MAERTALEAQARKAVEDSDKSMLRLHDSLLQVARYIHRACDPPKSSQFEKPAWSRWLKYELVYNRLVREDASDKAELVKLARVTGAPVEHRAISSVSSLFSGIVNEAPVAGFGTTTVTVTGKDVVTLIDLSPLSQADLAKFFSSFTTRANDAESYYRVSSLFAPMMQRISEGTATEKQLSDAAEWLNFDLSPEHAAAQEAASYAKSQESASRASEWSAANARAEEMVAKEPLFNLGPSAVPWGILGVGAAIVAVFLFGKGKR